MTGAAARVERLRIALSGADLQRVAKAVLMAMAGAAATVYLVIHLDQGWVPHDDGAFAQSALRVLDGELPHRDYAELYTGGLTFLNAGVLAVFGEDLIWLRVPVLVSFLACLVAVYALARRLVGTATALLIVSFAVVWGLPAYPAAVPSWYLLALGAIGTLTLVKYLETRSERWLVLAGLCGGLSVTIKVTGVWYVAASILFLLFLDSEESRSERWSPRRALTLVAVPMVVLAAVLGVLRSHLGTAEIVYLGTPVIAVCACLPLRFVLARHSDSMTPVRLARRFGAFAIGCLAPLAVLAVPFVAGGALDDLLSGMFLTPQTRLESGSRAYVPVQSVSYVALALPLFAVLALRRFAPTPRVRRVVDLAGTACVALALLVSGTAEGYQAFWHTAKALVPWIVVAGTLALVSLRRESGSQGSRARLYLLLTMTAFLGLVQFPFAAPIYFCFFAVFAVLAAVALLRSLRMEGGVLPVSVLAALVIFGFAWLNGGDVYALGFTSTSRAQSVILDERRASIVIRKEEQAVYARATDLLKQHSAGAYAFAGPDCPELYVLSDLKNPTRSLFDHLDPTDSARGASLLRALQERDVTAIALNWAPDFSDTLDPTTLRRLRRDFPNVETVGKFEIRWRQPVGR